MEDRQTTPHRLGQKLNHEHHSISTSTQSRFPHPCSREHTKAGLPRSAHTSLLKECGVSLIAYCLPLRASPSHKFLINDENRRMRSEWELMICIGFGEMHRRNRLEGEPKGVIKALFGIFEKLIYGAKRNVGTGNGAEKGSCRVQKGENSDQVGLRCTKTGCKFRGLSGSWERF